MVSRYPYSDGLTHNAASGLQNADALLIEILDAFNVKIASTRGVKSVTSDSGQHNWNNVVAKHA